MTRTSVSPAATIASPMGNSRPGGMSIALICGMAFGKTCLQIAHACQLRRGNRIKSGILNAFAVGMTALTTMASASTSDSPRGTNSTEILIMPLLP